MWGPTPLEHAMNVIKLSKWGETPYQNMSFGINLMTILFFFVSMCSQPPIEIGHLAGALS